MLRRVSKLALAFPTGPSGLRSCVGVLVSVGASKGGSWLTVRLPLPTFMSGLTQIFHTSNLLQHCIASPRVLEAEVQMSPQLGLLISLQPFCCCCHALHRTCLGVGVVEDPQTLVTKGHSPS